jgi:glycosyltransferase involved in cell wall biosynthesis
VSFIHIGDGPLRASVEALTRDLGIQNRCRFEGHRDDVPQQLEQMDLFVMSSKTEGLPNALMEAMAGGLPCVVTDAGGCREIVDDGETGFVVPIGDDQKLADRIVMLLADPRLRYQMGQKGRQSMYEYNCDRMAERYRRLYHRILQVGVN